MLFPPPWFSPLGTPLSEAPPLRAEIHQGGKPIQGDTARLSLVLCVAALQTVRVQHMPNTACAEHGRSLGGRHHIAALPIPPTPQGIRSHRPHYVLPPECPSSCFGGQGRAVGRLVALHTAAASPRNASGGNHGQQQADKACVPSPAGACKCSAPSGLRPRPCSFSSKGTPTPGSPEPSTSSGKRSSSK
jgi:hypothetical protein